MMLSPAGLLLSQAQTLGEAQECGIRFTPGEMRHDEFRALAVLMRQRMKAQAEADAKRTAGG